MKHANTHRKHQHISSCRNYTFELECIAFVVQPNSLQCTMTTALRILSRADWVESVKQKKSAAEKWKISFLFPVQAIRNRTLKLIPS
ncbi:hypothetical protein CEXT_771531 [Caerostris extrusa]|uniref:Uncharacterized protein n=1 Tax=Caerostris extrusa TaxID=172846 RepID=A0AAV4XKE1_CAEEX|nr:hypothetical protein CEXT_771531 [Caerostris extrusa]